MARYRVLAIVSLAVALTAGVTWTFAQPRTTALRAQEYMDIQQLDAAYNHALDASDADRFTSLFTQDGSLAGNTGHEALAQVIRGTEQTWQGNWRHLYSNLTITPTAEGANGSSFLLAYDVTTKPATITNTGGYTDKLVKTPSGWRFKERTFTNDAQPR